LITASIIVEWYNVTYAEPDRAARMLTELRSQATLLHASDNSAPVRLAEPLDVVITFDCNQHSAQHVQSVLGNLTKASDSLVPRLLPVPNANYCEMKNAGAMASRGEIIIFLDADLIPEPNWLSALLGAFVDPRVSVVVGNTYVDCSDGSTYAKSMALSWMFPLRDSTDRLTLSTWFYANNVAFRRDAFLSRQFPQVPGLTHAPAGLLVERLQRDGVAIWHAGNARASHPPPNGPIHFLMRAIAGGRARAFSEPLPNLLRWIREDIGSISWGGKQIVLSGAKVGLSWWQLPLAIAIPAAYFALFNLGSLLSLVFPRMMRERFQL